MTSCIGTDKIKLKEIITMRWKCQKYGFTMQWMNFVVTIKHSFTFHFCNSSSYVDSASLFPGNTDKDGQ